MSILNAIAASSASASKGVFSEFAETQLGAPCPKICNGVQAPQRAGKCANVWLEVVRCLVNNGRMPNVQEVIAQLPNENVNNVKIEFYRAVKYVQGLPKHWADNGITPEQREAAPETVAEVKATTTSKRKAS